MDNKYNKVFLKKKIFEIKNEQKGTATLNAFPWVVRVRLPPVHYETNFDILIQNKDIQESLGQ